MKTSCAKAPLPSPPPLKRRKPSLFRPGYPRPSTRNSFLLSKVRHSRSIFSSTSAIAAPARLYDEGGRSAHVEGGKRLQQVLLVDDLSWAADCRPVDDLGPEVVGQEKVSSFAAASPSRNETISSPRNVRHRSPAPSRRAGTSRSCPARSPARAPGRPHEGSRRCRLSPSLQSISIRPRTSP